MNPHLFAKGKWIDIRRLQDKYLKMTVTYTPEGDRHIETHVEDE